MLTNTTSTPTTLGHTPSSTLPDPQGAINDGKSKLVHPVLPTFLQPLADTFAPRRGYGNLSSPVTYLQLLTAWTGNQAVGFRGL